MVEESDIKYDEVARKLAMVRSQSGVRFTKVTLIPLLLTGSFPMKNSC